jgi:hypothetical protein
VNSYEAETDGYSGGEVMKGGSQEKIYESKGSKRGKV